MLSMALLPAATDAAASTTTAQDTSASIATQTPQAQNSGGGGLFSGFMGMVGDIAQGVGTGAAGYFNFKGMQAQAEAPADLVKEYMKHKKFLERQGRIEFTNNLIAAKVKGAQAAAFAASEATAATSRQRTYVLGGLAVAIALGVGGSLLIIARRS